ncbi:MAG TPA: hypothetical protein VK901_04685, partial [Nitrospiraceae bacterium]|nr:hypothetical protein [Nitrospiraceae bacterium]
LEDVDFDLIGQSYMETPRPSPLYRHDGNTFAARLDFRRLRQVAQREIGHLEKSISREILDYKTQPQIFRETR